MASLLSPAGPDPGRISQILPTVKCSNCNQPVRIADLGDHVCPPPPTPAASAKPPMSPTTASFMQSKYQNIIANRPATPQSPGGPFRSRSANAPPPPPPAELQQRAASVGPAAMSPRVRAPSIASLNIPNAQYRPERVPSPLARGSSPGTSQVAFPTQPGPSDHPARVPSPLTPRHYESEPVRAKTPVAASSRTSSEPARPMMVVSPNPSALRTPVQAPMRTPSPSAPTPPARAPSNASQYSIRHPVQSTPAQYASGPPGSVRSPSPSQRPRATSGFDSGQNVIYSTARPGAPPGPMRGPSPGMNMGPPARSPPGAGMNHFPPMAVGGGFPPQGGMPPPPRPALDVDTKTGGEAGMAGVGRRGFAAAARAAMFTHQMGGYHPTSPVNELPSPDHIHGMDGRRANAPRFLDIASAVPYASANTPPLSADSSSPHSPYSQHSPITAGTSPSSSSLYDGRASVTPTQPGIARTPSPSARSERSFIHRDRVLPPALEPPKAPLPDPPKTPSTPALPFFEKFKKEHPTPPSDTTEEAPEPEPASVPESAPQPAPELSTPLSPSRSESEWGGLAYADSTTEEGGGLAYAASTTDEAGGLAYAASTADDGGLAYAASTTDDGGLAYADDDDDDATSHTGTVKPEKPTANKVRFPSMSGKSVTRSDSKYSSSSSTTAPSPRLPMRSLSQSTSYTMRSNAKSTGALDHAMETLFEEDATSPTTSSISSPAMYPLALAQDSQRDSMRPKLPMRSHTSPGMGQKRPESRSVVGKKKAPRVRNCLKCEKTIDDGRWIKMEGGGVMCGECWKNMYLPKCRRCNKTIEKQAVSSSDGQLKGKYHRECFNCHTCHKPFPDKSFYVLDGKPFCAYHYHEANNSLCAAATCGQPIEGPCAVSHSGDRYHPEHFLCEHPRCNERLVEYWEVDGKMFCEKHANTEDSDYEDDEDEDVPLGLYQPLRDSSSRATKRVTRFIDLGAGGLFGSGSGPTAAAAATATAPVARSSGGEAF